MDQRQQQAWKEALRAKRGTQGLPLGGKRGGAGTAGIGPNKAAGRKGGIRRQGSKRG
jgi:hypothetical protein